LYSTLLDKEEEEEENIGDLLRSQINMPTPDQLKQKPTTLPKFEDSTPEGDWQVGLTGEKRIEETKDEIKRDLNYMEPPMAPTIFTDRLLAKGWTPTFYEPNQLEEVVEKIYSLKTVSSKDEEFPEYKVFKTASGGFEVWEEPKK
jgi:hypothetical protein